jgi:hypothetical protein
MARDVVDKGEAKGMAEVPTSFQNRVILTNSHISSYQRLTHTSSILSARPSYTELTLSGRQQRYQRNRHRSHVSDDCFKSECELKCRIDTIRNPPRISPLSYTPR